jgi:carbamate kinase
MVTPQGERSEASLERWHIAQAARALAPLAAKHQLVICHGNIPQLGQLALESEGDNTLTGPYPLDVLGPQTQGMIGYWLVQELHRAGVQAPLAALITQTVVDRADPGFRKPREFIGPGYTNDQVQLWGADLGWRFALDGANWRRVVPLLRPVAIREIDTIKTLADAGTILVCGGGGGVPVSHEDDVLGGVDGVVAKDLTAEMLAIELDADRLLVLTDIDCVKQDYGGPQKANIDRISADELATMTFDDWSIGPKIEACIQFTRATGRPAAIGALRDAADVLAGRTGTTVSPAVAVTANAARRHRDDFRLLPG